MAEVCTLVGDSKATSDSYGRFKDADLLFQLYYTVWIGEFTCSAQVLEGFGKGAFENCVWIFARTFNGLFKCRMCLVYGRVGVVG